MTTSPRSQYLDVLKALAIFAIVLFHAGFLKYGYLGVDLFLVISGYFTTRSLSKKLFVEDSALCGWKQYVRFIWGRVVRLLPLLLLAGTVSMAIGALVMVDDIYETLTQSVIASNFFANNVIELLARGDYWKGDVIFDPLMQTWYVGLLMQFYILYPVFFFLARLDKKNPSRTLLSLLATVAFLSLCLFLGGGSAARKFYLLPARFFEFAAGGIIALTVRPTENPDDGKGIVRKIVVYGAYILLMALFAFKAEWVSAQVKLLLVVALSSLLVASSSTLENKVTGNPFLASVGKASYSIFIWHQLIFAFYRTIVATNFSWWSFLLCLLGVILVSYLSYRLVEKPTARMLADGKGKVAFYVSYGTLFVVLNVITFLIYLNAGVIRDIPELEVSRAHPQRGMCISYTSRGFSYDKSFESDKRHWLVIGNSFGLDFSNLILESEVSDSVELSYLDNHAYAGIQKEDRFRDADKIFISSRDVTEEMIRNVEIRALASGLTLDDVIVVGEKYYGDAINRIYARRFRSDYFQTCVTLPESFIAWNDHLREVYGTRFIDLVAITSTDGVEVPVFTPDHKFISWDSLHFTRAGAAFIAGKLNWKAFF